MKNILFVSIAFPPKKDPECLQTAKYFKYLVRNEKVNIEVLTAKMPTLFMPYDPHLEKYIKNEKFVNIVEIPIYENKYCNFLMRKLGLKIADKPDSKFTFHLQWRKALKQLKNKPDVIYSRSYPLSSAFMAYKLKRHFNIPWVLHLSDPWADSPLHHFSPALYDWHNKKEKLFFDQADSITLTSEEALAFYKDKYKKHENKFKFSPNVFDEEDAMEGDINFDGKLQFAYTGGLVGDRSPETLIEAINYLNDADPEILSNTEFIFAGEMDRRNRDVFLKNKLPFVKHIGALKFYEALQLQNKASVLLIIDNPLTDPKSAMFFPSKLLDYLLAKKRIFAITPKNSPSYKLLMTDADKSDCFTHTEIKEIAEGIKNAVQAFKNRELNYFRMENLNTKYSASYNAERLFGIISSL